MPSYDVPPVVTTSPKSDRERIEYLEGEVRKLNSGRISDIVASRASAFLSVNDEGYTLVRTDLGILTFQLDKVEASGTGSKAFLSIGNPSSANITRLKLKTQWGVNDAAGDASFEGEQSLDREISTVLPAGRWTKTTILLDKIPPSKLGWLRVYDVNVQNITLFQNN